MTDRGPTKAALMDQIAAMEQSIDELREERDHWRRAKVADSEAEALSACVKALDALNERTRTGYGNVGGINFSFGGDKFRRVLKYLADRYGVEWPTPQIDTELTEAARAVLREWDQRGDGGCTVAIQQHLRQAVEEVRRAS